MNREEFEGVMFFENEVSEQLSGWIGFSFLRDNLLAILHSDSLAEVETFRNTLSGTCDGANCIVVVEVVGETIKVVDFHSPSVPVDDIWYLGIVHNLVSLLVEESVEDFSYTLFPHDEEFEAFNKYCEQILSNNSISIANSDGWNINELYGRCCTQKGIASLVRRVSLN